MRKNWDVTPLFFGTFNLKFVLERSPLAHFFQFFTLISNMVFSKTSIGPIGRADTHGPSPPTCFGSKIEPIPPPNVLQNYHQKTSWVRSPVEAVFIFFKSFFSSSLFSFFTQ